MKKTIIQTQALTKQYRGSHEMALHGLDLLVNEGEFFGLLGPNGSGKTTTISILCGLLAPTAGKVIIANHPIQHHLNLIKPLIGLVPQEIALYPSLTFIENLRFFGQLYGLNGKFLKKRIDECIEIAGLHHDCEKAIQAYSGGMKRRANLAVGLLHQPQILFLDEPTVNVDPQSRNAIFDILKQINAQGTTIVYTTHYLEEAEQLCTQVAIMDQGKIIQQDTPAVLIANTPGATNLGEVFLHLTGKHLRD